MRVEKQPARLRVASYNVRKCVGIDRRRSPERVLDVVAELEADVVAVQEADRRLGERPAAIPHHAVSERTGLKPVEMSPDGPSLGWHGNALFVRADAAVEGVRLLHLPALEPRGAVIADLRFGDRPIRIVATHLGLTRRFRRRQAAAIADALDEADKRPTVILGDFNEWSRRRGLEPLAEEFEIHAPGRSFHAARPVAALDRIATGRDIRLENAGVHEKGAALKASDHLPIWADLGIAA